MIKSKIEVQSNFLKHPQATSESFKKEKEKKRSRISPSTLSTIFLLVVIIGAGLFCFFGGVLNVKDVTINGSQQISKKDIEDLVKKSAENKLILSVNPVSIERELLQKFSLLSYARVTKELPSTLVIEVKERTVSNVIKTLENVVLVSQDGVVIDELDASKITNNAYEGLSVVTMTDEPKKVKGDHIDPNLISTISSLVQNWNSLKAPNYVNIFIDKEKSAKVVLESGTIVLLSLEKTNIDTKKLVEELKDVYNRLSKDKKIKTLDMRFDKIAVRYS